MSRFFEVTETLGLQCEASDALRKFVYMGRTPTNRKLEPGDHLPTVLARIPRDQQGLSKAHFTICVAPDFLNYALPSRVPISFYHLRREDKGPKKTPDFTILDVQIYWTAAETCRTFWSNLTSHQIDLRVWYKPGGKMRLNVFSHSLRTDIATDSLLQYLTSSNTNSGKRSPHRVSITRLLVRWSRHKLSHIDATTYAVGDQDTLPLPGFDPNDEKPSMAGGAGFPIKPPIRTEVLSKKKATEVESEPRREVDPHEQAQHLSLDDLLTLVEDTLIKQQVGRLRQEREESGAHQTTFRIRRRREHGDSSVSMILNVSNKAQ